ncbi:hypothetical protein RJ639_033817 [Escallonia herrerae]|uniref:Multiple C2 domain-containing protein n=1 Tax=Escallonia herrerae TaxID=1293975 RepID=A0AA88WV08_9ASTE|nr:hypothetical protein RJ639_033817 [Escallonia herrerae]
MHYVRPSSVMQLDMLHHQAVNIVTARLGLAKPPLRKEVAMRRSKANFFRQMSVFSGLFAVGKWFGNICMWRNPITTVLVHVLFIMLVCFPELILSPVFLYMFLIGIWNFPYRPRYPPPMNTKISQAEAVHPDELDEEFDVPQEVGITTVIAEAKPVDKAEKVKELQAARYITAMVGDGINDSPALVAPDVGMAIGAGTDIAIEAADIALLKRNLEDVITAIDPCRKTFFRIRLNYLWALGYNLLGIRIAAGVLFPSTGFRLPPWIAGAAMAASSVCVVCSSLLLKNYIRPKILNNLEMKEIQAEWMCKLRFTWKDNQAVSVFRQTRQFKKHINRQQGHRSWLRQ